MHSAILAAEWEPAPCLRSSRAAVCNNPRALSTGVVQGARTAHLSEQSRVIL